MKIVLNIARIFVGVLFIFSGLIKANDPLGLSYKMQEFFEVWGWSALNDYSLVLSLVMNVFEVVAGIALLVGYRMKLISWLLFLLIVFFTFLTGYAYLSGKIKTCGCFGDCVPLTAFQSFLKDLILFVLTLFILFNYKKIRPVFSPGPSIAILLLSIVAVSWMQAYALKHLPFVDCLPYKQGNNISEKMKVPPGAIADSSIMTFTYKHKGQNIEFDQDHFPDDFDSTYEFVERHDKLIRQGNATPAIVDFALRNDAGDDITQQVLETPGYYMLVFVKDFGNAEKWMKEDHTQLVKTCLSKNIPVRYITSEPKKAAHHLDSLAVKDLLICDATVIKTAARANPTYFLMNQASVYRKISAADISKMQKAVEELKAQ